MLVMTCRMRVACECWLVHALLHFCLVLFVSLVGLAQDHQDCFLGCDVMCWTASHDKTKHLCCFDHGLSAPRFQGKAAEKKHAREKAKQFKGLLASLNTSTAGDQTPRPCCWVLLMCA